MKKSKDVQLLPRIYKIPDSYARLLLTLRLVDGMRWAQIADYIGLDDTPDKIRRKATRCAQKYGFTVE